MGVVTGGHHQAVDDVEGRRAGEQRGGVAVVAQAQMDQVEAGQGGDLGVVGRRRLLQRLARPPQRAHLGGRDHVEQHLAGNALVGVLGADGDPALVPE